MNELGKTIQERTENIIKRTMERAERIKQREFALARKRQEELFLREKQKVDNKILTENSSLKARMILEFKLKEENFKHTLIQNLLEEVKQQITSLDERSLLSSLKNLILEATINLDIKKVNILLNKRDASILRRYLDDVVDFVRKKVDGFEIIHIEDDLTCSGGVIVKAECSNEFFDNTFERRFKRFDEEFKTRMLTVLDQNE